MIERTTLNCTAEVAESAEGKKIGSGFSRMNSEMKAVLCLDPCLPAKVCGPSFCLLRALRVLCGDSLFPITPQSNRNSFVGVLLASYRDAPKA